MTTQALAGGRPWIAFSGRRGGVPLGAILGALAAVSVAAVGWLHLDRLPFTVCYFKALTGWACLSCGTTRALGRLFELDVAGALVQNPLATVGVLALAPWALADLVLLVRGRALTLELSPALARVARVPFVAAVLANWTYLLVVGR
jgi:Protein of unknown function (DUF2752)